MDITFCPQCFTLFPTLDFSVVKIAENKVLLPCSSSQPAHSWVQTFFYSVFEIFLEPPFENFDFEVKCGSSKGHITSLEVINESLHMLWMMGGREFICSMHLHFTWTGLFFNTVAARHM